MENEILENTPKKETNKTKKLIMIIGTIVVFVGLLVLAIIVFKTPVKVSFSAKGYNISSIEPAIVDENGKIQVPDEKLLARQHMVFLGWYKNAEGKGEALDLANMTFDESITVYAIWDVVEYKIEYDLDGGELEEGKTNPTFYTVSHDNPTISDELHNNNEWKFTAEELNNYIKERGLRLNEPTKSGATFDGWQIIDEKGNIITGMAVSTIRLTPQGNITLKAKWA